MACRTCCVVCLVILDAVGLDVLLDKRADVDDGRLLERRAVGSLAIAASEGEISFANGVVIFLEGSMRNSKLNAYGRSGCLRCWPWLAVVDGLVGQSDGGNFDRGLSLTYRSSLPSSRHVVYLFFLSVSLMLWGDDDSFHPQYLTQLANTKYSHSVTPEWAEMRGACILRQLGRCADHTPVLFPSRCGSKAAAAASPRLLRLGLSGALRMIEHILSGSIGFLVLISTSQISKGGHSPSHALGRTNGASHLRRRPRFTRTHTMTPPLTPSPCQNSCAP